MENQYDKVFTIREASKYFKIPSSTLYRYIKKGKITCSKEGKQWKLKSSTLIQWLRKKNKKLLGQWKPLGFSQLSIGGQPTLIRSVPIPGFLPGVDWLRIARVKLGSW